MNPEGEKYLKQDKTYFLSFHILILEPPKKHKKIKQVVLQTYYTIENQQADHQQPEINSIH